MKHDNADRDEWRFLGAALGPRGRAGAMGKAIDEDVFESSSWRRWWYYRESEPDMSVVSGWFGRGRRLVFDVKHFVTVAGMRWVYNESFKPGPYIIGGFVSLMGIQAALFVTQLALLVAARLMG